MTSTGYTKLLKTAEEDGSPSAVTVQGSLPAWLKGSFLGVGPGRFEIGDFKVNHWLDGYAILVRFLIKDGKVDFQRKYLASDALKRAVAAKKPCLTELGTRSYPDPNKNILSRVVSSLIPIDFTDNCVANVYKIQDSVYAATETCFIRKVDPETLDSPDKLDLYKLFGANVCTSHPCILPDGTVMLLGTSLIPTAKYVLYKIPPTKPSGKEGKSGIVGGAPLATVSSNFSSGVSFNHSFGVSENYAIIVENSLVVSSTKLIASQAKGYSFLDCFDWTPTEKGRFILVERSNGNKVKVNYATDSFFFLHVVNAYEISDHLIVDILAYKTSDILQKTFLDKLRTSFSSDDPGCLKRFILPLNVKDAPTGSNLVTLPNSKATAVKQNDGTIFLTPADIISQNGFELPIINPEYVSRKYRYVYVSGFFSAGFFENSIAKVDVETGEIKLYKGKDSDFFGQPVFVPNPQGKDEDDGVVAFFHANSQGQGDSMRVVDAKSMTEVAQVVTPKSIPFVFHASFFKQ